MMNFYQLYPALLDNIGASDSDVYFGLYDGYDGVYPFMTANVTAPYTIAMTDLSKTGPVVLEIPAGEIYGVIDDTWMQPIKENALMGGNNYTLHRAKPSGCEFLINHGLRY